LENINPESLMGAKKRQNKIWEYREMLLAWRRHCVITYAGYILGFPTDTPETIARDIEIIKKELPIDILEFLCLTPLPGSEDHKILHARGMPMDQTITRRAVASRLSRRKIRDVLTTFSGSVQIEGVHPLQLGIVRRKVRTQRRYGMPIPSPLLFYPRAIAECAKAMIQWGLLWYRYHRMITRIHADPAALSYLDEALRPHSGQAEVDSLLRRLLTRFLRLTVRRCALRPSVSIGPDKQ
jgi:hypothetical protein